MYRKNDQHKQQSLFSSLGDLPAKQRERLETSWAVTFYTEFFSRIDESTFAVLYSDVASRPNAPINVLVGLDVLKSGFGWSDASSDEVSVLKPSLSDLSDVNDSQKGFITGKAKMFGVSHQMMLN